MDWIKRNLLFVIGGAVALVLMGLAGYYLYLGMAKNDSAMEKLNAEYTELKRLNDQVPNPGNESIDNTKAAKAQEQEVRSFIGKTARVFQPISSIPNLAELNNASYAGALRRTVDQMRKDAAGSGVQIPPNYYFSFAAVKDRIQFDKDGLVPLATQLGEVKTICSVLFAARVNALDSIRRQKVSKHDAEFQQTTDYTPRTAVTNQMGIVTPYEVSIRCFSAELAAVLSGYATSVNGLLVRAINVEPAVAASGAPSGTPGSTGAEVSMPGLPGQSTIGLGAGSGVPSVGGGSNPALAPASSGAKGGLASLLDEKQLRVVLLIEIVKLAPKK